MNPLRPGSCGCLLVPVLVGVVLAIAPLAYMVFDVIRDEMACSEPAPAHLRPYDDNNGARTLVGRPRDDIEATFGKGSSDYHGDAAYHVGKDTCLSWNLLILTYDDSNHVATAEVTTYVP